jgi:glycosyltransferase involved in cell wall biosynthesis
MARRKISLMVGTDPSGKGGVSSVVTVLHEEGFFDQQHVRYVISHVQGSSLQKLEAILFASLKTIWLCSVARPSIVHVHASSGASFMRKSFLLAIARVFGCKTIFHLHGAGFQHFALLESGSLMKWWIRRTLDRSSKVIALSESWATFLSAYAPGANINVVPNSVKVVDLPAEPLEETGRILFLGRLEKRKGIFDLLAAVALLKHSFPMIKLIIGGDGDLNIVKAKAHELNIDENVEVLGWINPDQKANELTRAAIFTLPSYDEGLPMAMLEAMVMGKAIVVTPVGGIPEAVKHGQNGLLVPSGDINALASALSEVLQDRLLCKAMGVNARNTIKARFSTVLFLQNLSKIYSELENTP